MHLFYKNFFSSTEEKEFKRIKKIYDLFNRKLKKEDEPTNSWISATTTIHWQTVWIQPNNSKEACKKR